jgi:hypothetical protein
VSAVDSNKEILRQVQEVVIPIIRFTLENKLIGECSTMDHSFFAFSTRSLDLFDNMYELVDNLTFKLASISPNMWPVFELTYSLFKSDAVDFLDGERRVMHRTVHT